MNMKPILRMLSTEDFLKMLTTCQNARERFYLQLGRNDPDFEYHIDLPTEDGKGLIEPLVDMPAWLDDETRFPNG